METALRKRGLSRVRLVLSSGYTIIFRFVLNVDPICYKLSRSPTQSHTNGKADHKHHKSDAHQLELELIQIEMA